jgi:hypothetical protein
MAILKKIFRSRLLLVNSYSMIYYLKDLSIQVGVIP